jgi:hypothetical protein
MKRRRAASVVLRLMLLWAFALSTVLASTPALRAMDDRAMGCGDGVAMAGAPGAATTGHPQPATAAAAHDGHHGARPATLSGPAAQMPSAAAMTAHVHAGRTHKTAAHGPQAGAGACCTGGGCLMICHSGGILPQVAMGIIPAAQGPIAIRERPDPLPSPPEVAVPPPRFRS